MRPNRIKSYSLVAIQFACLLAIALTGPIIARAPWFLVGELAALGLAAWAVLTVRLRNINVTPDVRAGSRLVREGPYHFIRHPMYASILLGALMLVVDAPSWWRWLIWLVLVLDLVIKLDYEERLLAAHFPAYVAYQETSKRLIPFVY
ncbi:MAG: isoprenylcysteine carboxylmethyltransferase family protein [Caldilineaceae bacterium]|nr:isoprenylcysteine carboxylmethyltransferase family protein [Caldilineaceae bacterium]